MYTWIVVITIWNFRKITPLCITSTGYLKYNLLLILKNFNWRAFTCNGIFLHCGIAHFTQVNTEYFFQHCKLPSQFNCIVPIPLMHYYAIPGYYIWYFVLLWYLSISAISVNPCKEKPLSLMINYEATLQSRSDFKFKLFILFKPHVCMEKTADIRRKQTDVQYKATVSVCMLQLLKSAECSQCVFYWHDASHKG